MAFTQAGERTAIHCLAQSEWKLDTPRTASSRTRPRSTRTPREPPPSGRSWSRCITGTKVGGAVATASVSREQGGCSGVSVLRPRAPDVHSFPCRCSAAQFSQSKWDRGCWWREAGLGRDAWGLRTDEQRALLRVARAEARVPPVSCGRSLPGGLVSRPGGYTREDSAFPQHFHIGRNTWWEGHFRTIPNRKSNSDVRVQDAVCWCWSPGTAPAAEASEKTLGKKTFVLSVGDSCYFYWNWHLEWSFPYQNTVMVQK